jgi:hypothetical protein
MYIYKYKCKNVLFTYIVDEGQGGGETFRSSPRKKSLTDVTLDE